MGGRGSKKFSTGVLRKTKNPQNKGITFPAAAMPGQQRAQGINPGQTDAEFKKRLLQDEAWANTLTKPESDAAMMYQGSEYADINKYLRTKANGAPTSITPGQRKDMKNLTTAFDKASLTEPVVVYRGIRSHSLTWDDAQKMVGTTVSDPAFGSASLSPLLAKNWAAGSTHAMGTISNPYISYRINLPKGAKAAVLGAATGSGSMGEHEILIQRGALYNVSGAQQRVVNNHHYIFVTLNYAGHSK